MRYRYKVNHEIINVWSWDDDLHDTIEIEFYGPDCKSYKRTIRIDSNNNKFFTWNKEKIYLKDYLSYTMQELKEKIEKKESVKPDDLCQAIIHDGIENVKFECPLHPISTIIPIIGIALCDGNKYVNVPCKLSENRYKIKDNYKISVIPIENTDAISSRDFYISDMFSLIQSGHIKIII